MGGGWPAVSKLLGKLQVLIQLAATNNRGSSPPLLYTYDMYFACSSLQYAVDLLVWMSSMESMQCVVWARTCWIQVSVTFGTGLKGAYIFPMGNMLGESHVYNDIHTEWVLL